MKHLHTTRTQGRTPILIVGSVAWFVLPMVSAFLLIGFRLAWWPLSLGMAMVGGTVLTLLLAWLAPNYLLIPVANMFGLVVVGLGFGLRDGFWPGRMLVDRDMSWLLATVVLWAGVFAFAAWLCRAEWIDAGRSEPEPLDDRVTPPRKGRLRNWITTGLTGVAAVAAASYMLWVTTLNIGYAVASEPGTLRATIDSIESYTTNEFGSRSTGWYLTTENGQQISLDQDDAIARDRDVFGRSPGGGGLYRGCYFRELPVPGDIVTLAGRFGPYGFAVDRVLSVSHNGTTLCDGDRERARRRELDNQ